MVETLNSIIHIEKIDMSAHGGQNPMRGRAERKFNLTEKKYNEEYIFQIDVNVYWTNVETDFMLDANINGIIFFKTNSAIPTVKDLFSLYTTAQREMNFKLLSRAREDNFTLDISMPEIELKEIEDNLKKCIQSILSK